MCTCTCARSGSTSLFAARTCFFLSSTCSLLLPSAAFTTRGGAWNAVAEDRREHSKQARRFGMLPLSGWQPRLTRHSKQDEALQPVTWDSRIRWGVRYFFCVAPVAFSGGQIWIFGQIFTHTYFVLSLHLFRIFFCLLLHTPPAATGWFVRWSPCVVIFEQTSLVS